MIHSASAYRNGRCKCEICTRDHARRHREEQADRLARFRNGTVQVSEHGLNAYENYGCRCDICKAAKSAKNKGNRRSRNGRATEGQAPPAQGSEGDAARRLDGAA